MTHKKPITKIIAGALSVVMVFGVLMLFSPTEAQAISLNATDTGFYNLAYGANGETTFDAGSQIRVINYTRENKNKSDAVYKFDGGMNWEPVDPNKYIVWDGITDNTFYGVYPYNADYDKFTIPTDQSGGVQDADWMTDDLTANKSVGKVQFAFQHRLAKVTVNITKWNSEFDGVTQTVSTPKIYSKGTALTATYDDSGVTIATTGNDTAIDPLVDGASYTAIVAPAKYDATDRFMTFTVNGQEMTVLAKTDTLTGGLQPGNHYTFNLTVGKDAVTLSSVSVAEWGNGGTIDGGVAEQQILLNIKKSAGSYEIESFGERRSVGKYQLYFYDADGNILLTTGELHESGAVVVPSGAVKYSLEHWFFYTKTDGSGSGYAASSTFLILREVCPDTDSDIEISLRSDYGAYMATVTPSA